MANTTPTIPVQKNLLTPLENPGQTDTVTTPPTAGFDIDAFASDIRTRGVVRTHSFLAIVYPPKILQGLYTDPALRRMIIRCEAASLPSMSFMTRDFYRAGYGSSEAIAYNTNFEPVNFTFLVDAQAEVYTFFYNWMNCIVNFNVSAGFGTSNTIGGKALKAYEVGYKDDYVTKMLILMYNEARDQIIEVTLHDAFPMSISEVGLSWGQTDELMKINVPVKYRDFSIDTVDAVTLAKSDVLEPDPTTGDGRKIKPIVTDDLRAQGRLRSRGDNRSPVEHYLERNKIRLKSETRPSDTLPQRFNPNIRG